MSARAIGILLYGTNAQRRDGLAEDSCALQYHALGCDSALPDFPRDVQFEILEYGRKGYGCVLGWW